PKTTNSIAPHPLSLDAAHYYNLTGQGINRNLDITATNLNTSAAWASGAIVSTLDDLALFQYSLNQGALFRSPHTLAQMRQVSAVSPNYGLGLQRATVSGLETWGHAGFWGVIMLHIPAKGAFLVLVVNQASRDMYQEAGKVLDAARRAGL
ncbi:MAG: serine hydrolase, partial [Thiothrix sp.]